VAILPITISYPLLLIFSTFRAKKGRKNGKSPSPQPLTKIKIEKFEKEIEF